MPGIRRLFSHVMALTLLLTMFSGLIGVASVAAQQGGTIRTLNKTASPPTIPATGVATVTLALDAEACGAVVGNRANVVLVIDRSGSMRGTKIAEALAAATSFVNNLQPQDQVAVVSFSSSASTNIGLTNVGTGRQAVLDAINGIRASGGTDIADGLIAGGTTLTSVPSGESKTLILLSDGASSRQAAINAANNLKQNQGVVIYSIGLQISNGSSAEQLLQDIAGAPTRYYSAPDPADLQRIYSEISGQIVRDSPIGTNATVVENYDEEQFEIVPGSVNPASGVVDATPGVGTITWRLDTITSNQTLSYQVRPKFTTGQFFASSKTSVEYTQGPTCANGGALVSQAFSTGALVTIAESAAIELDSFTATARAGQVEVRWVTLAEINTWGFHLLRSSDGTRDSAVRVTDELLWAVGRSSRGSTYTWLDHNARVGETYTYWLQEVETEGNVLEYGPSTVTMVPQSEFLLYLPQINLR